MESEALTDNDMVENTAQNEAAAMDTDESGSNNQENAGDTSDHMDTENATNETLDISQTSDKSNLTGGNLSSQSEQLDASHDNLATLAAVSAAGAEVNANPTQQTMEAEETNKPATNNNLNTNLPATHVTSNPPLDEEDAKWHTVGFFQGLSTTVTNYIDNSIWSSSGLNLNAEEIPDLSQHNRINLEPGTAYRFRIKALNSVGASEWSEISSFKTCLPGFPGAPSAIKISKSSEGAHLTWEPPPSCLSSVEIVEYSVYLAVKPGKEKEAKAGQRTPAQLAFVRVYVGAANQCTVSHTSLSAAHVDCSNKPAIIFRIAARNEKGYGPATQVRWLQDPVQNSANNPGLGPNSLLSPSRVKPELVGASPNKRFKPTAGGVR